MSDKNITYSGNTFSKDVHIVGNDITIDNCIMHNGIYLINCSRLVISDNTINGTVVTEGSVFSVSDPDKRFDFDPGYLLNMRLRTPLPLIKIKKIHLSVGEYMSRLFIERADGEVIIL